MIELFTTRVGGHSTEEGHAPLKKHSPPTYADSICRPLLIGQGANDPHGKYAKAEAFLAQCLGRRYEPVGEDFKGLSIPVLTGAKGTRVERNVVANPRGAAKAP